MILTEDLRLKNWINHPERLGDIQVCSIQEDEINFKYQPSEFIPIELTEDWLKRLGFKKFGRNDLPRTLSYKKDWISVFPANSFSDFKGYGFMYYKKEFAGSVESARTVIEYVHQLQNLFHSLTGSELEIK